ncbi:hypothetical protein LFM09_19185 [Lentzea alba]|uniref:hypothetical protein n=1 Tax=Lentzea alba TaxID=2714351 RepID=UPI0039BFF42B
MDPLEGAKVVAHWSFAADTENDYVVGEVLVRDDGVLLERFGGLSGSGDPKSTANYVFGSWHRVDWWEGHTTLAAAWARLRGMGYDLGDPSPVPIEDGRTGPFIFEPDPPAHLE